MKDIYRSWDIKEFPDPLSVEMTERVTTCLNYGILAPSTHNSQPWSLKLYQTSCDVRINKKRLLPVADPLSREAFISLGCFIENCLISAPFLNLEIKIKELIEDVENSFITLEFNNIDNPVISELERLLFKAIPRRLNARALFDKFRKLPNQVKENFQNLNRWNDQIMASFFETSKEKDLIASMTGEAVREAQSKKEFRKEFGKMIKNNLTNSEFGMPAFSLGLQFIPSLFAPLIFRNFDISKILQKINVAAMKASSAVVILSSKENNPIDWYLIGRYFERGNLLLIGNGLQVSVHIAAAELDKYAKLLMKDLRLNKRPQLIFRTGYSTKRFRHTPRFPIESFFS